MPFSALLQCVGVSTKLLSLPIYDSHVHRSVNRFSAVSHAKVEAFLLFL